jgi:HPt (histidine-containing phosphotransfer) domain-containing protein
LPVPVLSRAKGYDGTLNRFSDGGDVRDMEEQRSEKIIVHVDPELEDLIPGYLANRKNDIAAIHAALEKKDLDMIRILGHSMKGSGGGYGFETITDIGMLIEKAAKEGRNDDMHLQMNRLEDYLRRVEIVYG